MGNIVWNSLGIGIPTLSGPMFLALGLLLAMIAFRGLRNKGGMNRLSSVLLLACSALFVTFTGIDTLQSSVAVMGVTINADPSCNGGSSNTWGVSSGTPPVPLPRFQNGCPNSIQITTLTLACGGAFPTRLDPANVCGPNAIITSGGFCNLPYCTSGGDL